MSREYSLKQRLRVGVFDHAEGTSRSRAVYTDMRRTTLLVPSLIVAGIRRRGHWGSA
jgi:hypothetical protein